MESHSFEFMVTLIVFVILFALDRNARVAETEERVTLSPDKKEIAEELDQRRWWHNIPIVALLLFSGSPKLMMSVPLIIQLSILLVVAGIDPVRQIVAALRAKRFGLPQSYIEPRIRARGL